MLYLLYVSIAYHRELNQTHSEFLNWKQQMIKQLTSSFVYNRIQSNPKQMELTFKLYDLTDNDMNILFSLNTLIVACGVQFSVPHQTG